MGFTGSTITKDAGKSIKPSKMIAVLAVIGSAACWGLATVMSRDILAHFSAPGLLVVQLATSIALLSMMAIRERPINYMTPALLRASLTGFLEPGLAYTVGLVGLSMTTAGHSAVISSAEPIFIILVSWLLFRERPTVQTAGCIGVAIVGLVLVSSGEIVDEIKNTMLFGDMLIVAATLFAAGYVVLSARITMDFPPAILAGAQQVVGFAFAILIYEALRFGEVIPPFWQHADAWILTYAALSGVIQYAIPFWLYLIGLRALSANAAGLYLALTPVFGIVGAFFWLGEQPSLSMLVGAGLIVIAVFAGRREH